MYLFSALAASVCAQDPSSGSNGSTPPSLHEKIYVHYDKEFYQAGETIWFKAYLYHNGKPSTQSNNFYIRLANADGGLLANKKLPVDGASVKGNIDLPDSLPQGNYIVTAYTAITLQDDPGLIYRKNVFIFNRSAKTHQPSPPSTSLQFFPESGSLVDGITTAVAFKAIDRKTGLPKQVAGSVKASDGSTIPFRSLHDGMGRFTFRPDSKKAYTVQLDDSSGGDSLPTVELSGVNLQVKDFAEGKTFSLWRSTNKRADYQFVTLTAQMNGQTVYEQEVDFENYASVTGKILTQDLPSGILRFTVINRGGLPIAERLTFIDNRRHLANVAITVEKKGTGKREENVIEIHTDEEVQKSLSVSVTDATHANLSPRESILSSLLLTTDLRGRVHDPQWYFQNVGDTAKMALDNLLLVHGWTKYSVKVDATVVEGTKPRVHDSHLLKLSGLVKNQAGGIVKEGKLNIYIETKDSATQNYTVGVGKDGRFVLDSLLFYGTSRVFYNYYDSKEQRPVVLQIDSLADLSKAIILPGDDRAFSMSTSTAVAPYLQLPQGISTTDVKQLEAVTLQATSSTRRPFEVVNEKFTTGAFRAPGKVNLDNINQPTSNKGLSVVDYSLNQIRQLLLEGGQIVNMRNMSLGSGQKWPVAIFLDESPAEVSLLRSLRMDDIALIKFYEPGFVGAGTTGPGGTLAIYTKNSRAEDVKPQKMDFFYYPGFSVVKEFFSPDYATPLPAITGDYRTTIYWNPDIFLDGNSKSVKLKFYNNDFSRRLRVVVEGFGADGKLIHSEKIIE